MRARASAGGDEANKLIRIELERFARYEVIGCNNDFTILTEIDALTAAQFHLHATGNIEDIGRTALHVGILHRSEHFGKQPGRLFYRSFGIHIFILNQSFNGFDIVVIFQHHLMDFKDGSLLFAYL